jgi:hypothetical protein
MTYDLTPCHSIAIVITQSGWELKAKAAVGKKDALEIGDGGKISRSTTITMKEERSVRPRRTLSYFASLSN